MFDIIYKYRRLKGRMMKQQLVVKNDDLNTKSRSFYQLKAENQIKKLSLQKLTKNPSQSLGKNIIVKSHHLRIKREIPAINKSKQTKKYIGTSQNKFESNGIKAKGYQLPKQNKTRLRLLTPNENYERSNIKQQKQSIHQNFVQGSDKNLLKQTKNHKTTPKFQQVINESYLQISRQQKDVVGMFQKTEKLTLGKNNNQPQQISKDFSIKQVLKFQSQIFRKKLNLNKKVINLHFQIFQSQNCQNKIQELNRNVQYLSNKKSILLKQISVVQQNYKFICQQFTNKQKRFQVLATKCLERQQNLNEQQLKLQELKKKIQQQEKLEQQINKKGKQIQEYVLLQQQRKILQQVSQDYIKREADMYDYALQMQCNSWATGYKQVKPFTDQQKHLRQRVQSLGRQIYNDKRQIAFQSKCEEIKAFLLSMYGSFKRMNDDMRAINDFKTQCIREFVSRMQKWLQNWQLKQEYLVNLRKQFGIDEAKVNEYIQQLEFLQDSRQNNSVQKLKLEQIKNMIKKITDNYKLGNCFY